MFKHCTSDDVLVEVYCDVSKHFFSSVLRFYAPNVKQC